MILYKLKNLTCVLLFRLTLALFPFGLLGKAFPRSLGFEAFLSTVGFEFDAFLSTVGLAFELLLSILFLSFGFETFLSKGCALISLGFLSTRMFSYTGVLVGGLLLGLVTIPTGDFLTFSCPTDETSARGDFSETRLLDEIVGAAYPRAAVRMPVKVLRRPEGKPIGVRIGEGAPSL